MSAVLRPVPTDEVREVARALGLDRYPSDAKRADTAALLAREAELLAEVAELQGKLRAGLEAIERDDARNLDVLRVVLANVRLAARHGHEAALELPTRLLIDLIANLERR